MDSRCSGPSGLWLQLPLALASMLVNFEPRVAACFVLLTNNISSTHLRAISGDLSVLRSLEQSHARETYTAPVGNTRRRTCPPMFPHASKDEPRPPEGTRKRSIGKTRHPQCLTGPHQQRFEGDRDGVGGTVVTQRPVAPSQVGTGTARRSQQITYEPGPSCLWDIGTAAAQDKREQRRQAPPAQHNFTRGNRVAVPLHWYQTNCTRLISEFKAPHQNRPRPERASRFPHVSSRFLTPFCTI